MKPVRFRLGDSLLAVACQSMIDVARRVESPMGLAPESKVETENEAGADESRRQIAFESDVVRADLRLSEGHDAADRELVTRHRERRTAGALFAPIRLGPQDESQECGSVYENGKARARLISSRAETSLLVPGSMSRRAFASVEERDRHRKQKPKP